MDWEGRPGIPRAAPDADLAGYVTHGVSTAPYRYQPGSPLYASAEAAAARIPPTLGVIEAVDPHTCLLHTGWNSLDELAVYVALFGFRFQVHQPPELIAHIRDLTARLTDAVEEAVGSPHGVRRGACRPHSRTGRQGSQSH